MTPNAVQTQIDRENGKYECICLKAPDCPIPELKPRNAG